MIMETEEQTEKRSIVLLDNIANVLRRLNGEPIYFLLDNKRFLISSFNYHGNLIRGSRLEGLFFGLWEANGELQPAGFIEYTSRNEENFELNVSMRYLADEKVLKASSDLQKFLPFTIDPPFVAFEICPEYHGKRFGQLLYYVSRLVFEERDQEYIEVYRDVSSVSLENYSSPDEINTPEKRRATSFFARFADEFEWIPDKERLKFRAKLSNQERQLLKDLVTRVFNFDTHK